MFAGRIAVTVSFVLAERIFPCHTSTSLFTSQSRAGSRAHQVKDEGAESCFFFFFFSSDRAPEWAHSELYLPAWLQPWVTARPDPRRFHCFCRSFSPKTPSLSLSLPLSLSPSALLSLSFILIPLSFLSPFFVSKQSNNPFYSHCIYT